MNFLAVTVCALSSLVLGFIWYEPRFGKAWMKLSFINAGYRVVYFVIIGIILGIWQ